MAYQQVSQILRYVQDLRRRVLDQAADPDNLPLEEATFEFIAQLRDHECTMGKLINEHIAGASQGVLDTWIQFPDTDDLEDDVANLRPTIEQMPRGEETIQQLLALDQRIVGLYKTAASQTRAASVSNFFDEILQMESQKARAKSWNYAANRDLTDI